VMRRIGLSFTSCVIDADDARSGRPRCHDHH
jgi:hypothetical protein